MDAWVWIVIAVVAAIVVLAVLWSAKRRTRTHTLKEHSDASTTARSSRPAVNVTQSVSWWNGRRGTTSWT